MGNKEAKIHIPLKEFLEKENVCSLGVVLPGDKVHVAPLLCWCDTSTLSIYMVTSKSSEKMWWQRSGMQSVSASVAIGLSRSLPYSLQMRGKLKEFDSNHDAKITNEYLKIASRRDDPNNPDNVMVVFYPEWARYTNRENKYTMHQVQL